MVKLIASKEGTGKTKRIIDMANERLSNTTGNVVFIDDDKKHIYQLKHDMRFISMDEYPISSHEEFMGFVCGVISNNFDIRDVYIDGLNKVMNMPNEVLPGVMKRFDDISKSFGIDFTMTLTCENCELPESIKEYLVD